MSRTADMDLLNLFPTPLRPSVSPGEAFTGKYGTRCRVAAIRGAQVGILRLQVTRRSRIAWVPRQSVERAMEEVRG